MKAKSYLADHCFYDKAAETLKQRNGWLDSIYLVFRKWNWQ